MQTTLLPSDHVRAIVQRIGLHELMDALIARLTTAFATFEPAHTHSPARSGFNYTDPELGLIEWMPVMTGGRVTIKVVGYHPSNPRARQLPTILSTVSTYDTQTGHWIAVADGNFLTALRTGAASAIASRALAAPHSHIVGLIGAGAQAVTQLHGLSRVLPIEAAWVYDRDPAVAHSFRKRAGFLHIELIPVDASGLAQLVERADVLCTCTSVDVGAGPVFADGAHKPWLHVNAIGSDFPGKTELPLSLLQRSLVVPDFPAQAMQEGECQRLSPTEIGPSLVDVVKNPERYAARRETTTVFDSTGWSLEDHVALGLLMDYARDLGLGIPVDIESLAEDPHDPYAFAAPDGLRVLHPSRQNGAVNHGALRA
ncbi:MAG: ornithine cyclodeaminase family protein [Anaerolineales bacterium]|nr:ornithine cyclodeaminase family protein [Anaerolineales bacterium]